MLSGEMADFFYNKLLFMIGWLKDMHENSCVNVTSHLTVELKCHQLP